MKVVGVGFGRTGTMSLKYALEQLGAGPCFHMIDLLTGERQERDLASWARVAGGGRPDWDAVFDGWESTVDWPACSYWHELVDAFPDSPVLLNVRDFDGWYRSCSNTIFAVRQAALAGELPEETERPAPPPVLWEIVDKVIWEGDFQGRFQDRDWMEQMYADRIETIRREVPSDRLTVWEIGDGWQPLADMLGVEAPDEPFPRLHDTDDFRTQMGLAPVGSPAPR